MDASFVVRSTYFLTFYFPAYLTSSCKGKAQSEVALRSEVFFLFPRNVFSNTSNFYMYRLIPALASMAQKYLPSTKAEIFPISPSPVTTEVPRAFLRAVYGGSDQHFLQIFRKNKHPAGVIERRVVFPQFALNPAMPSVPGQPGLVFASRHEILDNPPWSVFRKVSGSGQAVWLYLGDYESELVGKMTAKEFSDLATSVSRCGFIITFYRTLDL